MPAGFASYSEDKLRDYVDFFQNAPIGLHIVGPDGLIKHANRAELELLGYADRPADYIGHHIAEFHAQKEVIDDMLNRLVNGKPLIHYEATLKQRGGSTVPVVIYSSPRMSGDELVNTRCFTYPKEIASRADAAWHHAASAQIGELPEEEREAMFQLLSDFFEHAPVSLHIVGPDGIIKQANRAELAAMGYADDPEAYIGHHIAEFHADREVIDDMLEKLVSGRPLRSYQARLVRRDKAIYPVTIFSSPRIDDGSFVNTRCFTFPRHEEAGEKVLRFTWPRNEDIGAGEAPKGDSLTVALKYIAGRRRPEESLGFLAEVSKVFAAGEDDRQSLSKAAALTVPFLADWCSVDLPGEGEPVLSCRGELRDRVDEVRGFLAEAGNQPAVYERGEPVCCFAAGGEEGDGRERGLRELGCRSMMIVPVVIQSRVAGSLAFLRLEGSDGSNHGPADLALAEELARRTAAAVETRKLRRRVRELTPN